jgi:hypothetical protein
MQATWLAATTEFWRAHRQCAAVMHFVTLGYSRPDGQTSDHWLEGKVASLEWEPEFYRYVRDAFAPVGLMIDLGKEHLRPGSAAHVPVILVNDLERPWKGPVSLRLKCGERRIDEKRQDAEVAPFGTTVLGFDLAWPAEEGPAVLEAELRGAEGQPVHSVREFVIENRPASLTEHCTVTASSVYQPAYPAECAVDGDENSYWSSAFQDNAWLALDLGAVKRISRAVIVWENAYAKAFTVELSADGASWKEVYRTAEGTGGTTHIAFDPVEARHLRVTCTKRGTQWGNAIRELEVY